MMQRRLLIATALIALIAVPFLATAADAAAKPARGNPADILHNPRALARYLKLTAEQTVTMKNLQEDLRTTTRPLHEQIEPLQATLQTQLDAASPDACSAGATLVKIDGLRDDIRDAREDYDEAFSAILTPEQLAKYEALKDAVRIGEEEDAG